MYIYILCMYIYIHCNILYIKYIHTLYIYIYTLYITVYIYIYTYIWNQEKKSASSSSNIFWWWHRMKLYSIQQELGMEVLPTFTEEHKLRGHKDWRSFNAALQTPFWSLAMVKPWFSPWAPTLEGSEFPHHLVDSAGDGDIKRFFWGKDCCGKPLVINIGSSPFRFTGFIEISCNIQLQCEAPKIAKLVYNSNNYGLW